MTQFDLLQAIGDVDADLVERAAQPPRKAHPLRWVAAVAAAAVSGGSRLSCGARPVWSLCESTGVQR